MLVLGLPWLLGGKGKGKKERKKEAYFHEIVMKKRG